MIAIRWLTLLLNALVLFWLGVAVWRDPFGPTDIEDKALMLLLFTAIVCSIAVMIDLLLIRKR